jgi:Fe-S cluster assembly iron-binding protein IscA
MFDMTEEAATLVCALTSTADLGAGSGLRLTLDPTLGSLAMSLVAAPDTADDVFIRFDARVFVAPSAAGRLDAQVLDARSANRTPAFFLLNS